MVVLNRATVLVGFSLIIYLASVTVAEECIGIHNGCNSYGFFETYKALFTPACNEHDACYFCVSGKYVVLLYLIPYLYIDKFLNPTSIGVTVNIHLSISTSDFIVCLYY